MADPGDASLDLGDLGIDRGGHLLVKRALAELPVGGRLAVRGTDPNLALHLSSYCRGQGHGFERTSTTVVRGGATAGRWRDAVTAGEPGIVSAQASARWGLAPRGATVEASAPEIAFPIAERAAIWADEAARLYAQAAAAQWDPATAIPWDARFDIADDVEDAVVQVMTYLIENETAALVIPVRFAGRIHPHFREVVQLLAIQAADEARHIEVFTRRALLRRPRPGLSTAGGQESLKTLLDEPDFALASFLLSVLGEGTFLDLLAFLREHAPDPVTRAVVTLAGQDEARHVAFGMAHLGRHVEEDATLRARLADAIRRRHAVLTQTAGLNEEVFDALVLLAAGSWRPDDVRRGWDAVATLERAMDDGRRRRLRRLGFPEAEAADLSALHTRNFM